MGMRGMDRRRAGGIWSLAGLLACLAWLMLARPALAQSNRHCGEVNRNQTWTAQDAHIVECDVHVRNSTLTIAPNVQVLMNEGASLIVEAGAKLEILGNPDSNEPVRFAPNSRDQAKGFWGQILFKPGAELGVIQYAIIFGGGKDGKAMIEVQAPTQLYLIDLRQSGDAPLAFDANALGPSLEDAGQSLSAGLCNVINLRPGSHEIDAIRVNAGQDVDVTDSQFWHHFCMPYLVEDVLDIGGPDIPTLSLSPGVEIQFGPEAGILAGVDADQPGHFESNGLPDVPVLLTGVEKTAGSWQGITFSRYADPQIFNSLFNTRIEYGGSLDRPMVQALAPQLITDGAVFADAPGYPVSILPQAMDGFTGGLSGGKAFENNGIQRVLVLASESEVDLPRSSQWKSPGVPVEVDGDLLVAGAQGNARFGLDSGLHLIFAEGAGLTIGDAQVGQASIAIQGSRSRPVKLEGPRAEPGSWKGLSITDAALAAEIEGLDLGYGGAGDRPMLQWGDVDGFLAGSTLHDALGHPLSIQLSRIASVAGEDQLDPGQKNRMQGNGKNRVAVRVDGPYGLGFRERSIDWANPGAPLELDDDLLIALEGGLLLRMHGGLELRFAAGGGMQVGQPGLRGSLDFEPSPGGSRVLMGPADESAGWTGLRVESGGSVDGSGLEVVGVRGEDAVSVELIDGAVALSDLMLDGEGAGTGLRLSGASAQLRLEESSITNFGTGLKASGGAHFEVERSRISGNADWGVFSEGSAECQLATMVYWGSPEGPTDLSDAQDGCMNLSYEGGGDRVSDGVVWWRYAVDEAYTPAAGIGPGAITIYLPSVVRSAGER